MYKRKSVKKLGRTKSHREALIKNQLRSIMQSGKVETSSVKAKVLKGELSSLFNRVKKNEGNELSLTRYLMSILNNKDLVKRIKELSKKDTTKVTIKKVGFRTGDNTEMSVVEITGFKAKPKTKKQTKEEKKVEEEIVETKVDEEKKRGILNLGRKSISKKIEPMKKERARSRSGL